MFPSVLELNNILIVYSSTLIYFDNPIFHYRLQDLGLEINKDKLLFYMLIPAVFLNIVKLQLRYFYNPLMNVSLVNNNCIFVCSKLFILNLIKKAFNLKNNSVFNLLSLVVNICIYRFNYFFC